MDAANGKDAKQSYIFSDHFFGGSEGKVGGPYHSWNLQRNVGIGGQLMTSEDVTTLLGFTNIEDIVFPTVSSWDGFFEGKHGAIHAFIGGQLGQLNTAAQEPIFFMLHNFVDYLWWLFRRGQARNGVDPEHYPTKDQSKQHEFNASMPYLKFPNYRGYSNIWTDLLYTFEHSPICGSMCCNSKWLTCTDASGSKTLPKCRAKLIGEPINDVNHEHFRRKRSHSAVWMGQTLNSPITRSQQRSGNVFDTCPKKICAEEEPVQNTFEINGRPIGSEWDYMPVEVIFKRPPGVHFRSFKVINDHKIDESTDIFDSRGTNLHKQHRHQFSSVSNSFQPVHIATIRDCIVHHSGSTRVFVKVHGLSYEGFSTEYALVDQRIPVSSGFAYVPLKSPKTEKNKVTRVLLTAYDDCGRLCHALCRTGGTSSAPTYTKCSGIISIKAGGTHFCESDITAIVNNIWNVTEEDGNPSANYATVCVKFVCDSHTVYPWDRI